jgi:hypothetical protein
MSMYVCMECMYVRSTLPHTFHTHPPFFFSRQLDVHLKFFGPQHLNTSTSYIHTFHTYIHTYIRGGRYSAGEEYCLGKKKVQAVCTYLLLSMRSMIGPPPGPSTLQSHAHSGFAHFFRFEIVPKISEKNFEKKN